MTAAPHPLPRFVQEREADTPTRHDLDDIPLDYALRRISRGR